MPSPNSTAPLQLLIAHDTHPGARGKNNEDSYDVFAVPLQGGNGGASAQPMTVAVVADGVTSRTGGAQASQLAVKTIRALLEKGLANGPRPKQLEDIILRANREIHTFAQTNAVMENMSTTLVLVAVEDQQLYALHVGDSRAYLIRGNAVYQLTLDHTWVQQAIDEGRITRAEAKVHPNRHVIVRYLGIDQRVTIDPAIIIPDTTLPNGQRAMGDNLLLNPGDAILLCTDGLTDQIKGDEIADAVQRHWLNPQAAIKQLIDLALKRQEPDNITVVLIELPDGRSPLPAPLRKPLPVLVGLAGVVLVSLFLFGGSLMSSIGLQSEATPPAVAIANTAAQAIATATLPPAPPPTATPAAVVVAAPPVITPTATLPPPTLVETPLPATVTPVGAFPVATQTPTALPTNAATQTLVATATLAPSPTTPPTATPTPVPPIQIGLLSPVDGTAATGPTNFQWNLTNANARVTEYRLVIWPVGRQTEQVLISRDAATITNVTVDLNNAPGGLALVNNASYNWQLQLAGAAGVVVNSRIGEFRYTAPPTAVPTATPQPQQSGGGDNNDNDNDDNGNSTATPDTAPTGP